MQDYLEWKRSTTKNPATAVHYERWVRRFLGFLKEDDITLESFGRFRTFLRAELHFSAKNIQYGSYLIRDYISYQMTVHKLDFPLKLLKIPQERSKSHDAISQQDFDKMMAFLPQNEAKHLQKRLLLTMLFDTGMRVGELLRLKISELESQGAIIHNEKNHRNRRIGWSKETQDLIKFYLPLRKHMKPSKEDADFLFVTLQWRPCRRFTTRHVERLVEELRKKAKLKTTIRPHSFRHGFVHRQLEKRTPITTIAQMLGHSSSMNVMNYAQLNSKEIIDAWVM